LGRLAALALVLALLFAFHQTWLTTVGDFLVARDELRPADAIVVLAGNSPYRSQHADELYRQGLAPRVIISNEAVSSHGMQTTWLELRARGVVALDIPDEAIVTIEAVSDSTFEEAEFSRDLMLRHGWRSAILVTDPFHMRRATMIFRKAFEPAGLSVAASPAEGSKYGVASWWHDRNGIMRVAQEYLKFGYYLALGRI
jgi:uncharacterized SAM-binding protein YcdF (DUF218 family)